MGIYIVLCTYNLPSFVTNGKSYMEVHSSLGYSQKSLDFISVLLMHKEPEHEHVQFQNEHENCMICSNSCIYVPGLHCEACEPHAVHYSLIGSSHSGKHRNRLMSKF